MRILIVNTYYAPEIVGGAEYSVKKLAEGLLKAGHQVKILCTGDKNCTEEIDGVSVVRIRTNNICRVIHSGGEPHWKRIMRTIQDTWNPLNIHKIRKVLVDYKPDIIHTNGLYDITPVIWKVAQKLNIYVVHTLRDYMMCCPRVLLACEYSEEPCNMNKLFCYYHKKCNKIHTKYVDCVTAPSKYTLNNIIGKGYFKDSYSYVIYNATDVDDTKIIEKKNNLTPRNINEKIKFVYLGALNEQKGVKWLLESYMQIPDGKASLYIAGKGELSDLIVNSSKKYDVHFLGFLNNQKVDELLDSMDVLICPSLWPEPFGRVILDAYIHGLPVIVTKNGALPEIVNEGRTGLLVNDSDNKALEKAMIYFIENRNMIDIMGKQAIDEVKKYSIEQQVRYFEELAYARK